MKLCACAICKNEENHVDTWIAGLINEVDYIVVLDTGSTDSTIEKFNQYPNVIFKQEEIIPWRFDSARNRALSLMPDDTDVMITIDLDEIYTPGFGNEIRQLAKPGVDLISGYKRTFSEDGLQQSGDFEELSLPIIVNPKNWVWRYPVHEYPVLISGKDPVSVVSKNIICNHYPVSNKSRAQYIQILKNWYEDELAQYPDKLLDPVCVEKYTVELYQRGYAEESKNILLAAFNKWAVDLSTDEGRATLYRNALNTVVFANWDHNRNLVFEALTLAESSGLYTRSLYNTWADNLVLYDNDRAAACEKLKVALSIVNQDTRPYVEDQILFDSNQIETKLFIWLMELGNYAEAYKYAKLAEDKGPLSSEAADYLNKLNSIINDRSKNRICVYTVCRNEAKFVNNWVKCNKEADKIVALVHDCTDNTKELLEKAGVITIEGSYPNWRFDKPKNDAMHAAFALAPDCNIFVFTSLDELWEPGWAKTVKDNWTIETKQCWYNFVQSHDEYKNESGTSFFNWMHSRDDAWHWEYPIHEAILYGKNNYLAPNEIINLFSQVKLQHWPDNGKKRSYLDLHELRYKEYNDGMSLLYLIRECTIQGLYSKAIDYAAKEYDKQKDNLSLSEQAFVKQLVGLSYEGIGCIDKAISFYKEACNLDKNYRSALIRMANIYYNNDCFKMAEYYYQLAFDTTYRTFSWLENPDDWRSWPYYNMARIKKELGLLDEANGYIEMAISIDKRQIFLDYKKALID